MRRSFSLAMGLVLIVAMLGAQASVSVLAQSTPGASPVAPNPGGPRAVPVAPGVYVEQFGMTLNVDGKNDNLYLLRITAQNGSQLPIDNPYPAAIFHVESGQFTVNVKEILNDGSVEVTVGTGDTIKSSTGEVICPKGSIKPCSVTAGQSVVLEQGNSISMKNTSFTVGSGPGSAVKTFQPGFNVMTASVVQAITPCHICPGY